jgi:phosphoadenosine phosphosulfate reductase
MNYSSLIDQYRDKVLQYKAEGKKVFASSSFQTHSIPMLKILSEIDKDIPVVFLNTGFLFPETMVYRDLICDLYGLTPLNLVAATPRSMQKDGAGRFLFASDPDYCCHINKVLPMEPILQTYDVWINGVRADQNANRSRMKEEQPTPQGALRYHPMLPWTNPMIWAYIREHDIPRHPLDSQGYNSIGCEPCTRRIDHTQTGDERMARWFGMNKTECGLHTELIK